MSFKIRMLPDYWRIILMPVPAKTVLLIEPNDCHGEVLPGLARYFADLGYSVRVILSAYNFAQAPFCRMPEVKFFCLNDMLLSYFVRKHKNKIEAYDALVLTSSSFYYYSEKDDMFCALDAFALRSLKNLYVVEHELSYVERFKEETLLKNNRLLVLGNFDRGVMVNPHYFGAIKKHIKNDIVNFIVVGGINSIRKNHRLLIDAVEELVNKGIKNFCVTLVGRGNLPEIPPQIRSQIVFKGALKFPEMFDEMERADFFLPLLDEKNPDHERYITTGVTGSAQLIYGFLKPPLIERKFASFYGFDRENSFVYDTGKLVSAMQTAINMSHQASEIQKSSLKVLADNVYRQSFENLKKILQDY